MLKLMLNPALSPETALICVIVGSLLVGFGACAILVGAIVLRRDLGRMLEDLPQGDDLAELERPYVQAETL